MGALPPLERKCWMRRLWLAALAALLMPVLIAVPARAAVSCKVTYAKSWDGGGGFGANLTIVNQGDPLNGWSLTYTWPGSQQVTQGWSANWSQSANKVTATSLSWNGAQPTGAS